MERKQAFSGKHADITDNVLKAFFKIYNTLGYGFAERVYENSLAIELKKLGLVPRHGVSSGGKLPPKLGEQAALRPGDMIAVELLTREKWWATMWPIWSSTTWSYWNSRLCVPGPKITKPNF